MCSSYVHIHLLYTCPLGLRAYKAHCRFPQCCLWVSEKIRQVKCKTTVCNQLTIWTLCCIKYIISPITWAVCSMQSLYEHKAIAVMWGTIMVLHCAMQSILHLPRCNMLCNAQEGISHAPIYMPLLLNVLCSGKNQPSMKQVVMEILSSGMMSMTTNM